MVPVNKKSRRVGYKGLNLLSAPVSDKKARSCDKKIPSVSVTPLEVKAPGLKVSMKGSPRCGSLTN